MALNLLSSSRLVVITTPTVFNVGLAIKWQAYTSLAVVCIGKILIIALPDPADDCVYTGLGRAQSVGPSDTGDFNAGGRWKKKKNG